MATTATTSASQVLTAVYTALNVASITTTLNCPVYDNVPEPMVFPHLRISSPNAEPFDTFGAAGKSRTLTVDVFTQYGGQLRAIQIIDQVIVLLQYVALTVSGHQLYGLQYESDGEGADETIGGRRVEHRFVQFKVTVRES